MLGDMNAANQRENVEETRPFFLERTDWMVYMTSRYHMYHEDIRHWLVLSELIGLVRYYWFMVSLFTREGTILDICKISTFIYIT